MSAIPQHIVCINDAWRWDRLFGPTPVKGELYQVEGVFCEELDGNKISFYFLKGFEWIVPGGGRSGFQTTAFRPVDMTFGSWVEHTIVPDFIVETKKIIAG